MILTDLVVGANEWARRLVGRPGVYVAAGTHEVLSHVGTIADEEDQVGRLLSLAPE